MPRINTYIILLVSALLSSCHVGRFFYWNFADLDDYKKFPARAVQNPAQPFSFKLADSSLFVPPSNIYIKGKAAKLEDFLHQTRTVGFMVIRNDSILYQKYLHKYQPDSDIGSFSVAKSFVSALVGIAIADGYIKSVQDPICDHLPQLPREQFGKITVEHLLNMRSGIRYNESYINPFGNVAKYYYGRNLRKYIKQLKISQPPDEKFEYISVNTQLLAMIVENASQQPLEKYLEAKIWQPLGMEYPATWSVDSRRHQQVKAFCCLNAKMVDFAKFGRLYLRKGDWEGQQIIPADWVEKSYQSEPKNGNRYAYQWWHSGRRTAGQAADFHAEGILGQFIYLYPSKNILIVRFGKEYGTDGWGSIFWEIGQKN